MIYIYWRLIWFISAFSSDWFISLLSICNSFYFAIDKGYLKNRCQYSINLSLALKNLASYAKTTLTFETFSIPQESKPQRPPRGEKKIKKRVRIVSNSSSSDTDTYDPDSYVASKPMQKKHRPASCAVNNAKKHKKTSSKRSEKNGIMNIFDEDWGLKIPPIVLLQIFKYVVDDVGAVPFLCRWGYNIAIVCSNVKLGQMKH